MAIRAVVNVATTPHYIKGQARLRQSVIDHGHCGVEFRFWNDMPHTKCPSHDAVPYAFKAFALKQAASYGGETLLWADSSIEVIRELGPLYERIERDGYWISRNGWTNYEWTADSAYPALFSCTLGRARDISRGIPHVVATAFGISTRHETGKAIIEEYYRLASETRAFCGPWKNTPQTPCGPEDVLGHRHDQTALSVIAWRLDCKLTDPPSIFAYAGGETENTILVAKGI